ncbi:MAG TPA: hypothetical protein VKT29_13275 [Terriglobales bacterium]|nr:hypothetical protein [Terriglobales bacterium]
MPALIEAERWCEQVVARSLVTQRVVDCHRPAISVCAGCGNGLCEEHEVICPVCGLSFCTRCDHVCRQHAQAA